MEQRLLSPIPQQSEVHSRKDPGIVTIGKNHLSRYPKLRFPGQGYNVPMNIYTHRSLCDIK